MDLNYVNSLIDKYNNLVIYYKVGDIFRLEQRIPRGLNNVVVENIGKLMIIKIKRLLAYSDQTNKEDIRIFHRYIGSEELTDLGIHAITIYDNFAQINDDGLFPEDAIYKQYPWKYKVLINELKEKYIIILSDNSGIWKYDIDNSNVCIDKGSGITVTEIPSYTLPLLSVNGTIITSLRSFVENQTLSIDFAEDWDISNITDMSYMFYNATISELNLNNLNVSNVINMEGMFRKANISNLKLSSWDVSNVINMEGMFRKAVITNTYSMFYGVIIPDLDLSSWNVSNVSNISYMFYQAKIPNMNLSGWDILNVSNMVRIFWGAIISNLNVTGWKLSKVTDMQALFYKAEIPNLDLSTWDVSNVSNMTRMFEFAKITDLNLNKWNISNDTDISFIFGNDNNISSIILSKSGSRLLTQFPGNITDWKVNNETLTDNNWKNEWIEGPVKFTRDV